MPDHIAEPDDGAVGTVLQHLGSEAVEAHEPDPGGANTRGAYRPGGVALARSAREAVGTVRP